MRNLLFIVFALLSLEARSLTTNKIFIDGVVESFTPQIIKLRAGKTLLEVPRKSVSIYDLRVGESIRIETTREALTKMKHSP